MSSVKKVKNDGLEKSFNVRVPNEYFIKKYEDEIVKIQKNIKIDGFRKGHVPADVIKNKFSVKVLSDTCEDVINEEVKKIIDENGFTLATRPKIDIKEYDEKKDLEFEVAFELLPEIPNIDFGKIKLKKQNIKVSKKDIEDEKLHILRNKANWNERDKSSELGDKVKIDFLGKINGEAFEGGKSENYDLILGSKSFIDTFEEQLVDKKSGDEVTVKVKFPENYNKKELAGKNAVFEVKIKSVSAPEFPELTDDYLKNNFNIDNYEEFEKAIEKELKNAFDRSAKNLLNKNIINWLKSSVKIELPKSIVEDELKRVINDKMTASENKEAKKKVEDDVKVSLVLGDLAKKNNINAEKSEIIQEIYKISSAYPEQQKMLVDYYTKNQYMLNQISSQIIENKVLDYIVDKANLDEVDISIDEFIKQQHNN
ncbi:MAG: trigger factor [Rickettsiales bacterium]|jgi:trigger factor|nr:trigger factor [Rickettsiales bacterium]